MTVRHFAFGNLGRDKNDKRSTHGADLDALRGLLEAVGDERAAVFLCEIGEGDDNDELALVRKVFKGWRLYGRTTREPILLSPDQPRAKSHVLWVPDTAVKRWSPRRSWLTVNLADEDVSLLGGHPPAGAHGQGERPSWARGPLNKGFDNMRAAKRKRINRLHKRGRNVVCMADENDYDMADVHPAVQTVWHDRTDYGQVVPADGWTADFRPGVEIPFRLDSHDGHAMHGRFRRK